MTSLSVRRSQIAGSGLFVDKAVPPRQKLFKAINVNQSITPPGRWVNHCNAPNTLLRREEDGSYWLYATRAIRPNEELTVDYNRTPDFIMKPDPRWTC